MSNSATIFPVRITVATAVVFALTLAATGGAQSVGVGTHFRIAERSPGVCDFFYTPVDGSSSMLRFFGNNSSYMHLHVLDAQVGLGDYPITGARLNVGEGSSCGTLSRGSLYGVIGQASVPGGPACGIYGYATSQTGPASAGVFGRAYGSGDKRGVVGEAGSTSGYGVLSLGRLGTVGSKHFIQPHPEDAAKQIVFTCLEGNENGTYFRGSGEASGGVAIIEVPEEFRLASEADALTVQLTPVGGPALLWVESKSLDQIVVRTPIDARFDYFVQGIRRGYAQHQSIEANTVFVPTYRGREYGTQYPEAFQKLLIDNGILNADLTPNEATAARLGWTLQEASAGPDPAVPTSTEVASSTSEGAELTVSELDR